MTDVLKTHDLGNGWFANMLSNGGMTVRNSDKGQRIDLAPHSVETLRKIFAQVGTLARDDEQRLTA